MTFDLIKAQNALTEKQRNFVELWLVHRNAHYAYEHAYEASRMNPATSYVNGCKLLKNTKIAPVIEARLAALGETMDEETGFSVQAAWREFMALASANPDEVTGVRVGACRYCHGADHMYHWTPAEYAMAVREAEIREIKGGEAVMYPDPKAGSTSTVRPPLTPRAQNVVARVSCVRCPLTPQSYPQGAAHCSRGSSRPPMA